MTQKPTGQEKIEALTQESTPGDVADAFVTRYSEALDDCISNLPATREFLNAEGLEKEGQLDVADKRRHRAFLLRRMKEAVQTQAICVTAASTVSTGSPTHSAPSSPIGSRPNSRNGNDNRHRAE